MKNNAVDRTSAIGHVIFVLRRQQVHRHKHGSPMQENTFVENIDALPDLCSYVIDIFKYQHPYIKQDKIAL